MSVGRVFELLLILEDGEKIDSLFALCDLRTQVGKRREKGQRDLLGQWVTQLIGHDHELSISQAVYIGIVLAMLNAHNLLDILDLLVLHDLVVLRVAHIEKLAAQRQDAKIIAPGNTEARHGECLGGVSFSQYERAFGCMAGSGVVWVRELGDPS